MKASIISDQISNDLETAFSIIKQRGYHYVELHNAFGKSIEACSLEEVEQIKALLKRYDLSVSCIASTLFFLCPLYSEDQVTLFQPSFYAITGDADVHLSYVRKACQIAQLLSCSYIRVFPFRFPDNRIPPFGTKEHKERIISYIRKAVAIAKEEDVILVMENCPYSHMPKGTMTVEIIKEINDPHLRLLWDPANSFRANIENVPSAYLSYSLMEELEMIFPYIAHIHVKDYHFDAKQEKPFIHKAILDGDIDLIPIIHYLNAHGYDHVLSLEPEVSYKEVILCMDRLKNLLSC